MEHFLLLATVALGLVVVFGFINEKLTHLTYEIALLLFSAVAGIIVTAIWAGTKGTGIADFLEGVQVFDIERFLMDGVLCFMLFAGSRHLRLADFRKDAKNITILSILATLLGNLFYGFLFFVVVRILGLDFSLPLCLMIGSIVAPTDPIAATSILKKFGLPKRTGFLMEAESLLNDGVGVALFVVFSGMVSVSHAGKNQGFLVIMGREIFGAVLIGTVVTIIGFQIFKRTADNTRRGFLSLFSVAVSYLLCEKLECSGAIASVVCGLVFSYLTERAGWKNAASPELVEFDAFWDILDTLCNSVLYVILGLTFVRVLQMPMMIVFCVAAILLNLIARFGSVWAGTWLMGRLPDGYTKERFAALFTWGGLRGGLSVALAMSTASMVSGDDYHIILGCTYAIVFFTTVVQGLTMRKVYEKLTPQRTRA